MDYFYLFLLLVLIAIVLMFLRNKEFSLPMKSCGCTAMKRGYPCPYSRQRGGCPYKNCPRIS